MRLEEIAFHRVGLWSNLPALKFGPRVTLVLGDNEAGKTTAKRALEALLFGTRRELVAPLTSEQRFHASAAARLRDGSLVRWTRRGRAVEPEGALEQALPAAWASRFRDLFRLGHAEVRAIERDFLSETGAIGTMLFAASSGIGGAELAALSERLNKRLKEAESAAQSGDGLRRRLQTFEELHAAVKSAARFTDHAEQHASLAQIHAVKDRLTAEIDRVRETELRLRALARGLPEWRLVSRDRELLAALEEAGPIPPRKWSQEIARAREQLREAERVFAAASERARRASDEFQRLPPVPAIAPIADEIERLAERSAVTAKDRDESVALQRELAASRRELGELLGRLGVSPTPERLTAEAQARILPAPRRRLLSRLLAEGEKVRAAKARNEGELRSAERELEAAAKLARERKATPVDGLEQALAVAKRMELEDARLAESGARERDARAAATVLATKLGLASVPGSLAAVPVPDRSGLEAAWRSCEQVKKALEGATRRRHDAALDADAARAEVDEQRGRLGAPPTLEELQKVRAARQAAWTEVKSAWGGDGGTPRERLPELAGLFEGRVQLADDVADRRFADAERIGRLEAAQRRADELGARVAELAAAEKTCAGEVERAMARWQECWRFLKAPPPDHHAWLAEHGRLVQCLADAESAVKEREERAERRAALEQDAQKLLRGELPDAATLRSAEALAAAIGAELNLRREQNQLAAAAKATEETHRRRADAARTALADAAEAAEAWEREWQATVSELPAEQGRDADAVGEWLEVQERLARLTSEVRKGEAGLAEREAALAAFEAEAGALLAKARALDPGLPIPPALSPIDAARALGRLAREARELLAGRETAERNVRERRAEAEQEGRTVELRAAALSECWAAGQQPEGPGDEAIDAAIRRAEEAQRLTADIEQRTRTLEREWRIGIDAAVAEIGGRSEEALEAAAAEQANERKALESRRDEALREHGRISEVVKALENPLAAENEAAQALANAQAAVLEKAEHVAALRAALQLLDHARTRAAKASDPLIALASSNFARLTGGQYEALEIDRSGKEPALLAIPATGQEKTTDQLSDGTLDQLWLALRLAVAKLASAETPLPLVLDDVFVHFDDVRTTAALQLLAELSEELQVVIFTHHDHVADLAAQCIAESCTRIVLTRPEFERTRVLPAQRERVERPEAPVAQLDLGLTVATRAATSRDDACEQVLQVLERTGVPMSKPEILEAVLAGGGEDLTGAWNTIIKQLKGDGRVEQHGAARGARYALASASEKSASAS